MNKHTAYIIFFVVLIFGSCSLKEKEPFQESKTQILYDIIPTLFDSVFVDVTLIPPPPPPPWEMTKKDSLEYKKAYDNYLIELEQYSDTVLLAFQDSLLKIDNPEKLLKEHFNVASPMTLDTTNSNMRVIDINKVSLPDRFIIRSLYTFPEGTYIWDSNYDYKLAGAFLISNLEMEKTRTYGIIEWGFMCGSLCGHGGYAFIIKKDGKWIIDHISIEWVA
ncbi:hypothetical protein [Maribellus sediminis]|uniref:hypothetical protein n=1 Tax=Maribellus sediminis TaxID=2696285 RepID=UPI001431E804|nr:hypothetical protein [Maribellus sediminis]